MVGKIGKFHILSSEGYSMLHCHITRLWTICDCFQAFGTVPLPDRLTGAWQDAGRTRES